MTADIALSLKLAISRRHIDLTTPARCTVLRGKAFAIATHQNNPGTHPTVSPKSHISTGHPTSPRSGHCTYDNDKSRRHFPRNRMKEFPYARSLKTTAAPHIPIANTIRCANGSDDVSAHPNRFQPHPVGQSSSAACHRTRPSRLATNRAGNAKGPVFPDPANHTNALRKLGSDGVETFGSEQAHA